MSFKATARRVPERPLWLALAGLLTVAALLIWAWSDSALMVDEVARIERNRLPRLALLQTVRNADLEASLALRNVLALKDPALDARELQHYREASRDASLALQNYAAQVRRPDEQLLLKRALAAREALMARREAVIAADQHDGDPERLVQDLQAGLVPYLGALRSLQAYQDGLMRRLIDDLILRTERQRLMLTAAGLTAAVTVLLLGGSWRALLAREVALREERIAALQAQKQALVREVHHRIKNHLQGLLGLLEVRQQSQPAGESEALATLRGHVLALMGIHGLQARGGTEQVSLTELVRQQAALVRAGFPQTQVAVSEGAGLEGVQLTAEHAVPVALVVTELIVNALKHGEHAPVRVLLEREADGAAAVTVVNRLSAPAAFDWTHSQGLGTGLRLIATLVQDVGELVQQARDDELSMRLRLLPPSPRP